MANRPWRVRHDFPLIIRGGKPGIGTVREMHHLATADGRSPGKLDLRHPDICPNGLDWGQSLPPYHPEVEQSLKVLIRRSRRAPVSCREDGQRPILSGVLLVLSALLGYLSAVSRHDFRESFLGQPPRTAPVPFATIVFKFLRAHDCANAAAPKRPPLDPGQYKPPALRFSPAGPIDTVCRVGITQVLFVYDPECPRSSFPRDERRPESPLDHHGSINKPGLCAFTFNHRSHHNRHTSSCPPT